MEQWIEQLRTLFTEFGLRILAAIAILVIGRWAAQLTRTIVKRLIQRTHADPTIVSFVGNISYITILAFAAIAALSKLGIQTASFVAVLGAAGLAIGLALQGSLSNFAAGFLLLIFRPFKAGDYIEGGGTAGIVREIQIFTTTLMTPDNCTIIVPNAKLLDDNIVNVTAEDTRRIDFIFGVGYSDNIDTVKQVIRDVLNQEPRILKEPAPIVGVFELADSSVNLAVRPWVKTTDYWDVYFDVMEAMKKRFDAEGINIPFPQRDIHMYQHQN